MAHAGEFEPRIMAFLSWLDAVERIDTLILEIRHVQETIVSQLRVPELYEPFRYEDYYLWGRFSRPTSLGAPHTTDVDSAQPLDWYYALVALPSVGRGCDVLSKLWCPEFPRTDGAPVAFEVLRETSEIQSYTALFNIDLHDDCAWRWRLRRHELSVQNKFNANDIRLYDALRFLQLVKRETLRDKLILSRRGLDLFDQVQTRDRSTEPERRTDPLALFLIIRRGILHELHSRLEYFGDIVSTVQEILNLSLERDPTPTVYRRRDQGIYTTDLSESCRQIAREITSFFSQIRGNGPVDGGYVSHDDDLELIVHRYTRFYTSTVRFDVHAADTTHGKASTLSPPRAGFVRSSFWMPERPDLQPTIAHEVAHIHIKRYYDELFPIVLDGANDPLARLLRQTSYVLEQYSARFVFFEFSARAREKLLLEIACDIVSVAVHRTSFAFAQFLELVGAGCEYIFAGRPTADVARSPAQFGENITLIRERVPEWYLRIMLATTFAAAVSKRTKGYEHRSDYLENVVREGIVLVTGRVRDQLAHWMDGEQQEDWQNWYEMTNVLMDIVDKATVVDDTARWIRTARIEKVRYWRNVAMPYSRYVPELSLTIRQHCLGVWLDRLMERPRMLGNYLTVTCPTPAELTDADVLKAFRRLYLDLYEWTEHTRTARPEQDLFGYLIDIPWQAAILTAQDFLGSHSDNDLTTESLALRTHQWMGAMHEYSWLGRDIYHLALEFVVWLERPAIGRLKAAFRWLRSIRTAILALDKSVLPSDINIGIGELETVLASILSNDIVGNGGYFLAQKPSLALERLLEEVAKVWPQQPLSELQILDLGRISSEDICQSHPDHNRHRGLDGVRKEKWTDIYDHLATVKMDIARRQIDTALQQFIGVYDKVANGVAGSAPYKEVRGVLLDLIRIAHYLSIRPGPRPVTLATAHHCNASGPDWEAVFAQYLDVPVQSRKLRGAPGSSEIETLVPTRSIRIDRFSMQYERHLSSAARASAKAFMDSDAAGNLEVGRRRAVLEFPGYLPKDSFIAEKPLFWTPWGKQGARGPGAPTSLWRGSLSVHLLGRFDRLGLTVAKHTARTGPKGPLVSFFRRQQMGLPFAGRVAGGLIQRAPKFAFPTVMAPPHGEADGQAQRTEQADLARCSLAPLAVINVLLTQRSARLTFVERLIAEDCVVKRYHPSLSSPYQNFKPDEDIGLLTDGWGDIFLLLFGRFNSCNTFDEYHEMCTVSENNIKDRLNDVIALRQALFEDTLVVRTETSYAPLAVDAALFDPEEYDCTISVRLRPTLDSTCLSEIFETHIHRVLNEPMLLDNEGKDRAQLAELFSFSRTPGRIDYSIRTKRAPLARAKAIYQKLCSNCGHYDSYGVVFETLRSKLFHSDPIRDGHILIADHIESTSTIIGDDLRSAEAI